MTKLKEQLEVREQLLEAREKRIEALQAELQRLEKGDLQTSTEAIESRENVSGLSAE